MVSGKVHLGATERDFEGDNPEAKKDGNMEATERKSEGGGVNQRWQRRTWRGEESPINNFMFLLDLPYSFIQVI